MKTMARKAEMLLKVRFETYLDTHFWFSLFLDETDQSPEVKIEVPVAMWVCPVLFILSIFDLIIPFSFYSRISTIATPIAVLERNWHD